MKAKLYKTISPYPLWGKCYNFFQYIKEAKGSHSCSKDIMYVACEYTHYLCLLLRTVQPVETDESAGNRNGLGMYNHSIFAAGYFLLGVGVTLNCTIILHFSHFSKQLLHQEACHLKAWGGIT